jgi:hypothetical protein
MHIYENDIEAVYKVASLSYKETCSQDILHPPLLYDPLNFTESLSFKRKTGIKWYILFYLFSSFTSYNGTYTYTCVTYKIHITNTEVVS